MTAHLLPTSSLEVAIAQLNSQNNLTHNLEIIANLAFNAAQRHVQVLALPEGCLYMGDVEQKRALAEPIPFLKTQPTQGLGLTHLSRIAREHKIWVFAGGIALQSNDSMRPFNAHVVFNSQGEIQAIYNKIHLFDVDLPDGTSHRESESSWPGELSSNTTIVSIDGWNLGLAICYDLRFPELFRKYTEAGAHVLLVPSAFTVHTGKDHWHVLLRARAIENQCYVLAPAQWGRHSAHRLTYGKSIIIDPWGDGIAQVSDGVGLAYATLDPKRILDIRTQLPSLRHRRVF